MMFIAARRDPRFLGAALGNSVLRPGDLGEFVRQLSDCRLAARELEFSRLKTKKPIIGDARQENTTQATIPDQRVIVQAPAFGYPSDTGVLA